MISSSSSLDASSIIRRIIFFFLGFFITSSITSTSSSGSGSFKIGFGLGLPRLLIFFISSFSCCDGSNIKSISASGTSCLSSVRSSVLASSFFAFGVRLGLAGLASSVLGAFDVIFSTAPSAFAAAFAALAALAFLSTSRRCSGLMGISITFFYLIFIEKIIYSFFTSSLVSSFTSVIVSPL